MKLFISMVVLLCLSLSQDSINAFKLPSNQTKKVAHSDGKIIGGQVVDITKVPYQASLWTDDDEFLCGAVILNSYWLATAAHCIVAKFAYAIVGVSNLLDSSAMFEREYFYVHPRAEQRDGMWYYDIGLVKLMKELHFSDKVQPINLTGPGIDPVAGTMTKVSGFGRNPYKNFVLRLVEVPVVDFGECDQDYYNKLDNTHFCAGVVNGDKDIDDGDDGSPIVDKATNKLIGIVSMGFNTLPINSTFPSIYTNIADPSIREWIKEKTRL